MLKEKLRGTGVALVTPFYANGTIDFTSLKKLVNYLIDNQVDYLVPLGTTGESATLNKEQKKEVFECVLETNQGRVPVVAGIGGNNTEELIYNLQEFDPIGFSAILSVSPYYNKPNQEGIFLHYKKIAEYAPLPIILYNVPGRTGSNMTAETTLRIAREVKNVIGIKEASGNFDQIMQIIKNKPEHFMVISGDDGITLPMIALGAEGVISVVANAYPKDFANMTRLCLQGNFQEAAKLHYKLVDIINMLFADGSPGGIKAVLKMMHICGDHVRLPLANINEKLHGMLENAVKNYS